MFNPAMMLLDIFRGGLGARHGPLPLTQLQKARRRREAEAALRSLQVRDECAAANKINPERRQHRRQRERDTAENERVRARRIASNARHHALKTRQKERELNGYYSSLSLAVALGAVGRRRRRVKIDELGKNKGRNLTRLG